MDKPKYDKPIARDLSSYQIAHGACSSGSPFNSGLGRACRAGEIALGVCNAGSTVYNIGECVLGSNAGGGCSSGAIAG